MAASQNQLIGDQGKDNSPAINGNRVPMGRSFKKMERLDQRISAGCEKHNTTQKLQIVKKSPEESPGRHLHAPVIKRDEKHVDHIIAEYEKADFNRRLQMYLQLPQFGPEFDSIDRKEQKSDWSSEFKLRGRSFAAQMGMALGSALGSRGL